jgi:hypothetical protein
MLFKQYCVQQQIEIELKRLTKDTQATVIQWSKEAGMKHEVDTFQFLVRGYVNDPSGHGKPWCNVLRYNHEECIVPALQCTNRFDS